MLLDIVSILLRVLWLIIIVQAIMSWLVTFNVISPYTNDIVRSVWQTLNALTEPLYRPIRRILPNFGPLDLSPMVVIVIMMIISGPIMGYLYQVALGISV